MRSLQSEDAWIAIAIGIAIAIDGRTSGFFDSDPERDPDRDFLRPAYLPPLKPR